MEDIYCKECGKLYHTDLFFGGHLRTAHNMSIQEYYDKWKKKPEEGICPICGKPTNFINGSSGYSICCSSECKNKYESLIHKDCIGEFECKICGEKHNIKGEERVLNLHFSKHLRKKHNMSIQEYYDQYIKKEGEGICPICGNQTSFHGYKRGYLKYCSHKCKGIALKNNDYFSNQAETFKIHKEAIEEKERRIAEAKKIQDFYKSQFIDMNDPNKSPETIAKPMGALKDSPARRSQNDRFYVEVDTCDYDMKPKVEWL